MILDIKTLEVRGMKRLTFDGRNDLFLTPHGARTLEDYDELVELYAALRKKEALRNASRVPRTEIPVSEEMSIRNERFVDKHGFSMGLD